MSNHSIPQTPKRAAIYIRVSSEGQAEKVSPEAQEADCRALSEARGYRVIQVYRDTEKYRVSGRLVEPSAKRSDRPAYNMMLADFDAGRFDVLVAWRQDRLYRGVTGAVIALKDRVKAGLAVEMVSGGFDTHTMEVMAWASGVELEAKHERFMMGVGGRLQHGKLWNQPPPYGYDKVDGQLVINETEAEWVRKLFRWYAEGATAGEIHRRFVAGGAPQRRKNNRRTWFVSVLHRMLKKDYYWTGVICAKWDGVVYEIAIPPLIDREEAEAVKERRDRYQAYPAGNAKHTALAAGVAYCAACGTLLRALISTQGHIRKDGTKQRRTVYRCNAYGNRTPAEGCMRQLINDPIDEQIWSKLSTVISEPGRLENAIQQKIAALQAQEIDAAAEVTRLERALDELMIERQKIIGWARKEIITEADLAVQLMGLDIQAKSLRRELEDARLLTGDRASRLMTLAETRRNQAQVGMEALLTVEPKTEREAMLQLEAKRKLVQTFVERAWVHRDRSVTVDFTFRLDESLETVPISECLTRYPFTDIPQFTISVTI